jgi:hypothetical protein
MTSIVHPNAAFYGLFAQICGFHGRRRPFMRTDGSGFSAEKILYRVLRIISWREMRIANPLVRLITS